MYVTDEEYVAYAALLGAIIPAVEADRTAQLVAASEYIESQEQYLKGTRTERDQDYAYPRENLVILGFEYDDDETPNIVKKVQMELALEVNAGVDLYAKVNGLPVTKERVEGAVEVNYAAPTNPKDYGRTSKALDLMQQLLRGSGFSIPLVRVA
jgi:hypothetical protein